MRSRADRAAVGGGRRRFVSQMVLSRDGTPVVGSDDELRALEEHWGSMFGFKARMNDEACESRLQHCPHASQLALEGLPSLEEFCRVARSTRDSSLGLDGLPHSAWTSCALALTCLHHATLAIAGGVKPPAWLNAATTILIPKQFAPGETAYAAAPVDSRPLTSANTSAKAVDDGLGKVAKNTVHAVQIGFVRGRAMLANVLRLEGAVEAYTYDMSDEGGLSLFGVAAAFPSVAHEWMWRVLRAMRLCPDLVRVVQGLCVGAAVRIVRRGFRFSSPCVLWRPTVVSYVRHALGSRL